MLTVSKDIYRKKPTKSILILKDSERKAKNEKSATETAVIDTHLRSGGLCQGTVCFGILMYIFQSLFLKQVRILPPQTLTKIRTKYPLNAEEDMVRIVIVVVQLTWVNLSFLRTLVVEIYVSEYAEWDN